jgi:uncharacterized membrane protein (DUF373 family)
VSYSSQNGQTKLKLAQMLVRTDWHACVVRLLVSLLMIVLYLWMLGGAIQLSYSGVQAWYTGWAKHAESMIKDVVIILAALELIRTLQSYLKLGRVKLTFIIDAALVVLIGELISLWYRSFTTREVLLSLVVIVILVGLRIVTARYSPVIETNE